jgi:hypothetical protein
MICVVGALSEAHETIEEQHAWMRCWKHTHERTKALARRGARVHTHTRVSALALTNTAWGTWFGSKRNLSLAAMSMPLLHLSWELGKSYYALT